MGKRTNMDGKIRIYDGANFYLELDIDAGDYSAPIGTPRPDETLVLNRGKMDGEAHYVKGSDDKLMEPQAVSFTFFVRDDEQTGLLLDMLEAGQNGGTTMVNGNAMTTTKGSTQRDGSHNNPVFADTSKLTYNVEYLISGAVSRGQKVAEVFFPLEQQNLNENENDIPLALSGMCYGTISRISAFTAGTDLEA